MRRTVPLVLAERPGALPCRRLRATIVDQRGFAATPGSVEKLEIGTQSREDVVRLIGSPSAVATFNPNIWYYISQKQETCAFLKPTIIEQNVMQLNFNDSGRLHGDQEVRPRRTARTSTMVSRITPTAGKELTVLEQIMGNVGRFSGPRQADQPGRADRRRIDSAAAWLMPMHRTAWPIAILRQLSHDKEKAPVFRPGLFVSA